MAGFLLPFAVGTAAGSLPSLFGKKAKGPSPIDVSALKKLIMQSSERQRDIVGQVRPELTQRTEQFGQDIQSKLEALSTERERGKEQFLTGLEEERAGIGSKLFNVMQERSFRGVPAAEQRIRETLGGQFQSGAAQELLAQPTIEASRGLADIAGDISLQQEQQRMAATEKLFNLDQEFLMDRFGVEKGVLEAALASGRQDLMQEAQSLIDIADQETADLLETEKFGLSGGLAAGQSSARIAQERRASQLGFGSELLTTLLPFLLQGGGGGKTASSEVVGGGQPFPVR